MAEMNDEIKSVSASLDQSYNPMSKLDWIGEDAIIIKSDERETLFVVYNEKGIGWDYHWMPTDKIRWAKQKEELEIENDELKNRNEELAKLLYELKSEMKSLVEDKSKRMSDFTCDI